MAESAPQSLVLAPRDLAPRDLIDYEAVRVGGDLPVVSFLVTSADVEDYGQSVGTPGCRSAIATMHLLAITLAAITERMPLPATCVHVGQELEWERAVVPDARIDVRFGLVSRRTAGGSTLSAFSLLLTSDGLEVARGRILLQS
ncbi:MAG: hypothetical protein WC273_05550 [Dehalococcoidia bacterium]